MLINIPAGESDSLILCVRAVVHRDINSALVRRRYRWEEKIARLMPGLLHLRSRALRVDFALLHYREAPSISVKSSVSSFVKNRTFSTRAKLSRCAHRTRALRPSSTQLGLAAECVTDDKFDTDNSGAGVPHRHSHGANVHPTRVKRKSNQTHLRPLSEA